MKISAVEPILVDAGLGRVWLFVRVVTDQGVSGIGERLYTKWGFRELLEAQAAKIV